MQVIERHGGASHYVRPDRVYRTGVLAPTANFAPGQDVEAVAAAFTERSMNLSGMLGDASPLNFAQKMKLRWDAFILKMRVKKAIKAGASVPAAGTDTQLHERQAHQSHDGIAYMQMGARVAPSMAGQVQMLAHMTGGTLPSSVAQAQIATTMERWNNLRWNG